jgi:hypothetical protein
MPTTTTTTTRPCLIKSVTLLANEQFTLPPGGVLVRTSNDAAITSTCPIPPSPELKCYQLTLTADWQIGNAGEIRPWTTSSDEASPRILQYKVGGVVYDCTDSIIIPGAYGDFFLDRLQTHISGNIEINNMFFNMSNKRGYSAGSDRGGWASFCFKTFPEIGDSFEVYVNTTIPYTSDNSKDPDWPDVVGPIIVKAMPVEFFANRQTDRALCGCS